MIIINSTEKDSDYIHKKLQEYNSRFMVYGEDLNFHIKVDNTIVGGIVASILCDIVEVDFLYVEEIYRGNGYGSILLEKLEEIAISKKVKRIILNTYSFQAPDFYKRHGYKEVFVQIPEFLNYSHHYFVKELN